MKHGRECTRTWWLQLAKSNAIDICSFLLHANTNTNHTNQLGCGVRCNTFLIALESSTTREISADLDIQTKGETLLG